MGILDLLFGKRKREVLEALENGARIIDVRSPEEFKYGSVDGALNFPVDRLNATSIKKLQKLKAPLVVCCASGMRSASAKNILQQNGFNDVQNAGGWQKLHRWISE